MIAYNILYGCVGDKSVLPFGLKVELVFIFTDNSEIVGVGLLSSENKESVQWLIKQFKEMNTNSDKVRAVMTDKDFTERLVFKEEFPAAQLLICLFHTFRSFKREVIFILLLHGTDQIVWMFLWCLIKKLL